MYDDELEPANIPYEELKSIVFETIKVYSPSFQLANFYHTIGQKLVKLQIVAPTPNSYGGTYNLSQHDKNRVREILWDYVIERVLTIGDYHNNDLSYFSVTEYGEKILKAENTPSPHDPTNYLKRLKEAIPNLDPVIESYISESIRTYNINQLLSSTITLGCASEKALLLLIEIYRDTFREESKAQAFDKKISGKFIKTQFDEFMKCFEIIPKKELGIDLADTFPLGGIFQIIRENRNAAGHPTGEKISKDTLFAHLQVFISYCKYIYKLMQFLEKEKHD